jgi:aldehyde:ferredoxin oxidoreductase
VRNPEAASTAEPFKNLPSLSYYVDYLNGTTGSKKILQDVLDDSERLQLLQKMINLRQGKGTRESDLIPLRAVAPVYVNEYLTRSEYYDGWLRNLEGGNLPDAIERRHELLMAKRLEAFQQLCDIVYEKKGYTSDAVPKRETVKKFGLLDQQAARLLAKYGE